MVYTPVVLSPSLPPSSAAAAVLWRGGEALEADSCRKSSHSWRAAGAPGLICCISNITNHVGFGNTRLSSSFFFCLVPFSLFVSLSYPRLLSPSLVPSAPLRWRPRPSCENKWRTRSGETGRSDSLSLPAGDYSSNDDTERPH